MTKIKQVPWLNHAAEAEIFLADPTDIDMALRLRNAFDHDHGVRFKGVEIKNRAWVVGFIPEKNITQDPFELIFDGFPLIGESEILSIPAESIESEFSEVNEVIDCFDPPLISKTEASYAAYVKIRSSLIQMVHGSFYVFPKKNGAALLVNNGNYAMLAGPRPFVEKAIGSSIEASWEVVAKGDEIDPLWRYRLRQAMTAYGMD